MSFCLTSGWHLDCDELRFSFDRPAVRHPFTLWHCDTVNIQTSSATSIHIVTLSTQLWHCQHTDQQHNIHSHCDTVNTTVTLSTYRPVAQHPFILWHCDTDNTQTSSTTSIHVVTLWHCQHTDKQRDIHSHFDTVTLSTYSSAVQHLLSRILTLRHCWRADNSVNLWYSVTLSLLMNVNYFTTLQCVSEKRPTLFSLIAKWPKTWAIFSYYMHK